MNGQQSQKPNIHHCVLDLMMTLTDLSRPANRDLNGEEDEISTWARREILGLSHKCLRALQVPHFAGCLLNPGVGYIPDLNHYLPWDEEWFVFGVTKEDFRTTDKCIKNDTNSYHPTWLQPGETIYAAVINLFAKRIQNSEQGEQEINNVRKKKEESSSVNLEKRSKFVLFGPKLNTMHLDSGVDVSPKSKAAELISKYDSYHKGYRRLNSEKKQNVSSQSNEDLKDEYDRNPRVFWSDETHSSVLGSDLVSFARYIFSILSSSAGPEREFSRMGYLVTKRRSRYTPANTNKRLTLANLIPQKRRLEDILSIRQIKRARLFENQ